MTKEIKINNNLVVKKTIEEDRLLFELSGRLDSINAPEFEYIVKDSLDDIHALVFDLEGLEYISSAGLRVFLISHKRMNKQGKMVVINVKDAVYRIFSLTGFAEVLNIVKKMNESQFKEYYQRYYQDHNAN